MTTVYLLPCACGEKLRIDPSQAGLDVRCRCGLDVKAPTFRELSKLERNEEPARAPSLPEWGSRDRLLLGGGIIAGLGLLTAAWFWHKTPGPPRFIIDPTATRAEIEEMSVDRVLEVWNQLATDGLDKSELPYLDIHRQKVSRARGFMYVGLAVAAAGVFLLLSSLFIGRAAASGRR